MFGRFFQEWYGLDLEAVLKGETRRYQKEPPVLLVLGVLLVAFVAWTML